MDALTHKKLDARAKILKALAHPTRLFIVDELSKGTRCVADLTEMIQADMSTVSKHLSLLKNVGLIKDEKQGTKVIYGLATPCVLDFFTCLDQVLQANIQTQIEIIS